MFESLAKESVKNEELQNEIQNIYSNDKTLPDNVKNIIGQLEEYKEMYENEKQKCILYRNKLEQIYDIALLEKNDSTTLDNIISDARIKV